MDKENREIMVTSLNLRAASLFRMGELKLAGVSAVEANFHQGILDQEELDI